MAVAAKQMDASWPLIFWSKVREELKIFTEVSAAPEKRASAVKAAKGIALMTNTVPLAHRASNAFSDFLHTVFPKKPWPILWAQSAWEGIKAEHKILSVMYMGDGNANYTRPERLTVLMCIVMGTMWSLTVLFAKDDGEFDPTANPSEYLQTQARARRASLSLRFPPV